MAKKTNSLNEKNAKLAKKYGYDRHYFLEKLGFPLEKCGTNFCDTSDKRYEDWMKEREKYGFDSRETWNLNVIFCEWLYERLCMYKKKASKIIDLTFYKVKVKGHEYTQIEAIDKMIDDLEYILKNIDDDFTWKELQKRLKDVLKIWIEVWPHMWW